MTTNRDFAAEYFAACIDDRTPGRTLSERSAAQTRMESIYLDALDAGVDLAIFEIDERARLSLYPPA